LSRDIANNRIPLSDTLTYKMIIDCNMLASIMLNQIHHHIGGTNVIVEHLGSRDKRNANIMEKLVNPNSFSDSVGDSAILSFSRRLGNHRLLLGTPGNEIGTKKHSIASRKTTNIFASYPISIRIGHNDRWSGGRMKLQSKSQGTL